VFSLNVPVPGRVRRVAGDLHPELARFDRLRERHSLLLKRFDTALDDDADSLPRLRERLRPLLSRQGGGGLDLRVTGLDYFETPPHGPGPVVYLTVESADLRALHHRLCGAFGAVTGMEGTEYVPHVTLARGGRIVDAADLADRRAIDPVEWTAGELRIGTARTPRDCRWGEPAGPGASRSRWRPVVGVEVSVEVQHRELQFLGGDVDQLRPLLAGEALADAVLLSTLSWVYRRSTNSRTP